MNIKYTITSGISYLCTLRQQYQIFLLFFCRCSSWTRCLTTPRRMTGRRSPSVSGSPRASPTPTPLSSSQPSRSVPRVRIQWGGSVADSVCFWTSRIKYRVREGVGHLLGICWGREGRWAYIGEGRGVGRMLGKRGGVGHYLVREGVGHI